MTGQEGLVKKKGLFVCADQIWEWIIIHVDVSEFRSEKVLKMP